MRVTRCMDPERIRLLLAQVGEVVAEDGQSIADAEIDTERNGWLEVIAGPETLAVYKLAPLNGVTVEIHVNVLPMYRHKRHATCRAAFRWLLENTEYQKVIAWVPCIHRHIRRFAVEMGMAVEGNSAQSYLKNGALHDQWLLGITRRQMEEACRV